MRLELAPRRWILSPIAIKARDFDGNALLAFAAAERGFGVLLGNARLRARPYTPLGFAIEKNLRPGKATKLVLDFAIKRKQSRCVVRRGPNLQGS